tara:strand:+ start:1101 stop:1733 length:633 start_codon:yes stop_codon:yes gene_type:complete
VILASTTYRILAGKADGSDYAVAAVMLLAGLARLKVRGSLSTSSNKARIQAMLDQMPTKWVRELEAARKEQRNLGLPVTPAKPTVDQVIDTVLEITAGERKPKTSNWAGERGATDVPVTEAIRDAAMAGLELSHANDYPAWKLIGLARGMQLATRQTIWRRSQTRARNYLRRHQGDKKGKNWENLDNPSKGYMAYLIWGGEPAWSAWRKT